MLWASKAKKGVWRAEWICYLCRKERIVEEHEGIHEPHREAARKNLRKKGTECLFPCLTSCLKMQVFLHALRCKFFYMHS